jgi:signal transduction histidine kinase
LTILTASFYFLGIEPGLYLMVFFVISANAMTIYSTWVGVLWIIILALISSVAFILREGIQEGLFTMLIYGGGYFFFGMFGRAMMEARLEREKSQQLYEELQDYVYKVEELAVTKERNRLAREMHDSLGHRLTVAAVQLEGAQRLIKKDPPKAEEMVGTVREQVKQSLHELRQTVAALREPVETGFSIQEALERLIVSFEQATGLTANVAISDLPSLGEKLRLVLYRTVQEALTNVQKHAEAKQVWLNLHAQDGELKLLVSDNGKGLSKNAEENGFGLRGIRERVTQVGGTCFLEDHPGGGTQIAVNIPLPEESPDE